MADPVTMAIAGAGIGAATSDDPLKGAALGGLGGFAGGSFLGGGGNLFGGAQGLAGASTGLTAGGQQAAMLAAQNAGMGMGADMATKAALASNAALPGYSPMMAGLYDAGTNLSFATDGLLGATDDPMFKAGQMLQNQNQQQTRNQIGPQAPVPVAPPVRQPRSVAQTFPYGERAGQPFMPSSPQILPTANKIRPY